ncbi:MAG: phospholipase D family protein [Gammaproteobacteria bacterium]|nr:phospholipase D family protein [Gammaproteobacteria bacterium]MDH4254325.1 phospholipase D family protein [Gammaproteobacteria bacterium]MDH5309623.1 phospholipase D family protein [Gammaproteobacteria bacterium]
MNARRNLVLSAAAVVLAGCAALEPADLEAEFTPPPADSALWDAMEQAGPEDWLFLLNDGPTALEWRLRAIDSATESIDLQTFLWHFDTSGSLLLDHLVRAADRGVQVKVLVDDTFLLGEDDVLEALHEHHNIEYRVFNPYRRRASGFVTRQVLNLAEYDRLDHRMHNKSMIVDDRVAIVGGRNLGDEYFGLDPEANFRDMELMAGGSLVPRLAATFDKYWNDHWSIPIEQLTDAEPSEEALARARTAMANDVYQHVEEDEAARQAEWLAMLRNTVQGTVRILADEPPVQNPADRASAPVQVANELIREFDAAEDEILIISAYLIPTVELEAAVERAAARGVRVRILTNSIRSNNHLTAHSAYRNHIDELLQNGAELHEVRVDAEDRHRYMLTPVERKSLALHAKALVIDDAKVFIGSANLDPRSLRINTEMGLLVESPELNARVRTAVGGDFDARNAWRLERSADGHVYWVSNELRLDRQPAASFMQRIEDWFFAHLPIENEM